MKNIIFISHRSTDKDIADMLVDFFVGTGILKEAVFCSSLPGNDINERISGEVKAALQYLSQSYRIKDPRIKDMFLDIACEELGHMEMVATMVNLLNGHQPDAANTTVGNVEAAVLTGLTPMLANASGYPFNAAYINETGDLGLRLAGTALVAACG